MIAEIENTLKIQLIVSTVLMTPVAYVVATLALPDEFTLAVPGSDPAKPFDTKWVPALGGAERDAGRSSAWITCLSSYAYFRYNIHLS